MELGFKVAAPRYRNGISPVVDKEVYDGRSDQDVE
jgi:hypothetical protein